jgi:Tfp pilus assembly protein PilV
MSLLEAVVALVILGLSAVGYLDVFRSGARSLTQADDWERTVAIAESSMEAALLGDALQAQGALPDVDSNFQRQVSVRPWRADLVEVTVSVTSPRGVVYTVHRLVRER